MESNSDLSILQKVLGHAFFRMPTILRTIYGPQATVSLVGDVQVDYGKNIFAYLASYFIKMPKSGSYTLMLTVDKELQNEFWTRNFPTQSMRSEVHYQKGTVMEKYRFFRFLMHVKISDRTLIFNLKRSFLFFMQKQKLASELGTGDIGKLLLKQSIPATIGILAMSLNMIIDTIFVGQWIGVLAIAAITVVLPIAFLISSIGMGIGIGGSSIISRALGADKTEKAQTNTAGAKKHPANTGADQKTAK